MSCLYLVKDWALTQNFRLPRLSFSVLGFVIPDGALKRWEKRVGVCFIELYILLRVRLRKNKAGAAQEGLFDIKDNGVALYAAIKDKVPAKYDTIKGKHYDVYRGAGYKKALRLQQAWLAKNLSNR